MISNNELLDLKIKRFFDRKSRVFPSIFKDNYKGK